jgi:hypothetical protein
MKCRQEATGVSTGVDREISGKRQRMRFYISYACRGGAVFIDGAVGISLEQIKFDQCDGNGVFLSNFVRNSTVKDCDFWRTGDSAIAAVGSTKLMDGTANTYPAFNTIDGNWIDTVGVNTKQTSCYFKSVTYSNTIKNNGEKK